jgi:hypothetical protein
MTVQIDKFLIQHCIKSRFLHVLAKLVVILVNLPEKIYSNKSSNTAKFEVLHNIYMQISIIVDQNFLAFNTFIRNRY